jgi:hypothetical protein
MLSMDRLIASSVPRRASRVLADVGVVAAAGARDGALGSGPVVAQAAMQVAVNVTTSVRTDMGALQAMGAPSIGRAATGRASVGPRRSPQNPLDFDARGLRAHCARMGAQAS